MPSTDPKAIRRRIRNNAQSLEKVKADVGLLYKPIEEWDFEELARGRPRNADGKFLTGRKPEWLTPVLQAEIERRLKTITREQLSVHVGAAIKVMHDLMSSTDTDEDGRPLVPASVKLDAAKFIVEQVIGKAKVHVDVDTGDKLTAMLARALVNPDGSSYEPKMIEGAAVDEEDDDPADVAGMGATITRPPRGAATSRPPLRRAGTSIRPVDHRP
jgi:hypothetical protein